AGESCALDFDRPRSPTALQHAVHLERLFAPVGYALAGINGGGAAGALYPSPKARPIPPPVGTPRTAQRGRKSIVERYELWWCRAPTDRARSELLENGNKIGVLQQLEVMSHRLERATIRKLPLDFLQRHDLRGATHGDRDRLTQEGRTPHLAQGQYVAADRRVDDRVPDVRAPSCLIVFEHPCPGICAEEHGLARRVRYRNLERIGERARPPMCEHDPLEAARKTLSRTRVHS